MRRIFGAYADYMCINIPRPSLFSEVVFGKGGFPTADGEPVFYGEGVVRYLKPRTPGGIHCEFDISEKEIAEFNAMDAVLWPEVKVGFVPPDEPRP